MIYEIGIHYTGDTVYDQQIKIPNIPISKNQRKFWFGSNTIPHWDEDENNIWVKVPVLYNGLNKIYVDDSQIKDLSSIDDVMIFGDDFQSDTLDTSKWKVLNGTWSIYNSASYGNVLRQSNSSTKWSTIAAIMNNMYDLIVEMDMLFNYIPSDDDASAGIRTRISLSTTQDADTQVLHRLDQGKSSADIFEAVNNSWNNTKIATTNFATNTHIWYSIAAKDHNNTATLLYGVKGSTKYSINGTTSVTQSGVAAIRSSEEDLFVQNFRVRKYLPIDPVITYIKPYQRMFHIKNTIFNQTNKTLSYNSQYIETPVIELSSPQRLLVNEQIKNVFYYRGSNTSPDITQSGNIVDDSNIIHNYWDQNIISNSGWNNTIPSDYITYTSNTVIDYKYIQYKIPIPNHR